MFVSQTSFIEAHFECGSRWSTASNQEGKKKLARDQLIIHYTPTSFSLTSQSFPPNSGVTLVLTKTMGQPPGLDASSL